MQVIISEKANEVPSNEEKVQMGVFLHSFIPRTLEQVKHPLHEVFENQESFHQAVTGVNNNSETILSLGKDNNTQDSSTNSGSSSLRSSTEAPPIFSSQE